METYVYNKSGIYNEDIQKKKIRVILNEEDINKSDTITQVTWLNMY